MSKIKLTFKETLKTIIFFVKSQGAFGRDRHIED